MAMAMAIPPPPAAQLHSHRRLAHYVARILRQLGRPASLQELAALCAPIPASPDLLVSLCAINGSPLSMLSDRMIWERNPSVAGTREVDPALVVPTKVCPVSPTLPARIWEDRVLTCARKKKRSAGVGIPTEARRRTVLCLEAVDTCGADTSNFSFQVNNIDDAVEIAPESPHDEMRDIQLLSSEVSETDYADKVDIQDQGRRLLLQTVDFLSAPSISPRIEYAGNVQTTKLKHNYVSAKLVQQEVFESEQISEFIVAEMTALPSNQYCDRNLHLTLSLPSNENAQYQEEIPSVGNLSSNLFRETESGLRLSNISCSEAVGDCLKTFASEGKDGPSNYFNHELDFLGSKYGKDIEESKSLVSISHPEGLFESDLVLSIAPLPYRTGEATILPRPAGKTDNSLRFSMDPSASQPLYATPISWCCTKTLDMGVVNSDDQTHHKDRPSGISKLPASLSKNLCSTPIYPSMHPSVAQPLCEVPNNWCCIKTLDMDVLNSDAQIHYKDQLPGYSKLPTFPSKNLCNSPIKSKSKRSRSHNVLNKKEHTVKKTEMKNLPNFEDFVAAEEEGSGGYGTVYKAKRKKDGKIFAIKCPHANAPYQHISNELRMLERFGGRNFIIKYEGSFKNGTSDCFVLEHVEHDRPEVLKKEIGLSEILWYGYCMFKALASLHKTGIVHRDVKPGNFLFSRKHNKGYLIDFNLAMDLRHKYCSSSKGKSKGDNDNITGAGHIPSSLTSSYSNKIEELHGKFMEAAKSSKPEKNAKRRGDVSYLRSRDKMQPKNACKSQGEASGVTTAKTLSADKYREPVPCKGRKELINFAQESIQIPNQQEATTALQRKRVAAPLCNGENAMLHLSPMPLHSRGIPISGSGTTSNKGDLKRKREGPCVGTKGFRAPEVLLKSPHQDPKLDIWSAGVTLLYLVIGRVPFVGEPEQNIKEIAKLKGSEELWEVAKLHNRECTFPKDLFDVQWLPSTKLQVWCEMNTKRPEFLDEIPMSLFDLVDRCLSVNPRVRITAEDALRHEFFAPCRETLRKHRLLKQSLLESESVANG